MSASAYSGQPALKSHAASVAIEGVSLVDNYRNTFNNEIQRNGVDGLIKTLSDKNKAMAAQAAKR